MFIVALPTISAAEARVQVIQLRFQSDPNLGGVEKLSVSVMRPEIGLRAPFMVEPREVAPDIDGGTLAPLSAFMIKGWTRSYVAMSIMLCAWENAEFNEADLPYNFSCSFFAVLDFNHGCCRLHGGLAEGLEKEP